MVKIFTTSLLCVVWVVLSHVTDAAGRRGIDADDAAAADMTLPKLDTSQNKRLLPDSLANKEEEQDGEMGSGAFFYEDDDDDYDDFRVLEGSGGELGDDDDTYTLYDEYDYGRAKPAESVIPDRPAGAAAGPAAESGAGGGSDGDLHFVEQEDKDDGGLLYEYYNEYFEEDYEDVDFDERGRDRATFKEKVTTSAVDGDLPSMTSTTTAKPLRPKVEADDSEEDLSVPHIVLVIASGVISFILFFAAFYICCRQRQRKGLPGKKDVPFVIDATYLGSGGSLKSSGRRTGLAPIHPKKSSSSSSSSSIVKNYQKVPTSTKEFVNCASGLAATATAPPLPPSAAEDLPFGLENRNKQDFAKPLLP